MGSQGELPATVPRGSHRHAAQHTDTHTGAATQHCHPPQPPVHPVMFNQQLRGPPSLPHALESPLPYCSSPLPLPFLLLSISNCPCLSYFHPHHPLPLLHHPPIPSTPAQSFHPHPCIPCPFIHISPPHPFIFILLQSPSLHPCCIITHSISSSLHLLPQPYPFISIPPSPSLFPHSHSPIPILPSPFHHPQPFIPIPSPTFLRSHPHPCITTSTPTQTLHPHNPCPPQPPAHAGSPVGLPG